MTRSDLVKYPGLKERLEDLEKVPNRQEWITTENQDTFVISNGSYVVGSKSLQVEVHGTPQPPSEIKEISSTSFQLSQGVPAGLIVVAYWLEGKLPVEFGHNRTHEKGGQDELDISKLKGYDELVKAPNVQEFISTANQDTFFITNGSYAVGSKTLEITVDSIPQRPSKITELSSTSFKLAEKLPAGIPVIARWLEGKVLVHFNHGKTHEAGGQDELDISKLKGYEALRSSVVHQVNNVAGMKKGNYKALDTVLTLGYYTENDGGSSLYQITSSGDADDGGSVITLDNNLKAILIPQGSVNYKQFGAIGDGVNDDLVQIRATHGYANKVNLPVINIKGDFYIKSSTAATIKTNVQFGLSKFHIDEALRPRTDGQVFNIISINSEITLPASFNTSILPYMKQGTTVIPELAPYKNHYIKVIDNTTKVGVRQGANSNSGFDMEEYFYVDEGGRIVGEITWNFTNITSIKARKCDDSYLTVDGGTFLLSGALNSLYAGDYKMNGFSISRSRTRIKNQYVGLEEGATDGSGNAYATGFYNFSSVYDVELNDIRIVPRVYNGGGTYGIGGGKVTNLKLKNIVSEGTDDHWGVIGTNQIKNLYVDSCQLNRIDVHFHGWNFYIKDTKIGYKGFTLTGGGDLFIENTEVANRNFITFRADYGSKWDGNISVKNCKLIVRDATNEARIIEFSPDSSGDFGYQVKYGKSITVDNFLFDYRGAATSTRNAYLVYFKDMAYTGTRRIMFPEYMSFKDVRLIGRDKAIKFFSPIMKITDVMSPNKGSYDLTTKEVVTNAHYILDNIQTEDIVASSQDTNSTHLFIDSFATTTYLDEYSLRPKIEIRNCKHLHLQPKTAICEIIVKDSTIRVIDGYEGANGRARFKFTSCDFKPKLTGTGAAFAFTGSVVDYVGCALYPHTIDGVVNFPTTLTNMHIFSFAPDDTYINIRGNHSGTRLSQELKDWIIANKGLPLTQSLISSLSIHSEDMPGSGYAVLKSGPTASRPTKGLYAGFQYFDTTLGKPVFYQSGSTWKDGNGTTV